MESYRRYGPALLRKARRILRNEDDARDVLQGLFMEFLARGEEPRDLPLLYRAITQRCLNLLRNERNRARLLERETSLLAGGPSAQPDMPLLGLDALFKLQARVDPSVMETVVYRFMDEMGLEEIAQVMQVSRKTVQNRLARAHEELARLTHPPSEEP